MFFSEEKNKKTFVSPRVPRTCHRRGIKSFLLLFFKKEVFLACLTGSPLHAEGLAGKLVVGYQGWFGCPGDPGGGGYSHWLHGTTPSVEMLPDLAEFPASDTCQLKLPGGGTATVYSSANPVIVDHHFAWMQQYGLATAAVQRFVSVVKSPARLVFADAVLGQLRHAAEAHGRSFYIEYDLSGSTPADAAAVLADWVRLRATGVLASPAYQRQGGRPLVGFFGLGFKGRPWTPDAAASLLRAFRGQPGGAAVMLGVPAGWRTGTADSSPDPGWLGIDRMADVLSPWTVGRFVNEAGAARFYANFMVPDAIWAKAAGIIYMPVAFPGFSWANLKPGSGRNAIPRDGGRFFKAQLSAIEGLGVQTAFIAMFDELDEGTAIYKVVPHADKRAAEAEFLPLDVDGVAMPSDAYLRLAGEAALHLHGAAGGPNKGEAAATPK